jgi:hypothetical protein
LSGGANAPLLPARDRLFFVTAMYVRVPCGAEYDGTG